VTEVGALSAAGWAWSLHAIFPAGRGWLGVVDTRYGVSHPAADAGESRPVSDPLVSYDPDTAATFLAISKIHKSK